MLYGEEGQLEKQALGADRLADLEQGEETDEARENELAVGDNVYAVGEEGLSDKRNQSAKARAGGGRSAPSFERCSLGPPRLRT